MKTFPALLLVIALTGVYITHASANNFQPNRLEGGDFPGNTHIQAPIISQSGVTRLPPRDFTNLPGGVTTQEKPTSLKQLLRSQAKASKTSTLTPFIVGGSDVPAGERGFQVSLQDIWGHFCGGSLITREWVLTAAHCMSPIYVSQGFSVMVGTHDLGLPTSPIPVQDVIIHPDFDSVNLRNDVALLRLAYPAPEHLPLLKLADESVMAEYAYLGALATVSGWGQTDNEGTVVPVMQQVDVPIFPVEDCSRAHREAIGHEVAEDVMICAGYPEGGRDSCFGDSGGPLTVTTPDGDYSIGIVSWGNIECAAAETPGVYARTAAFTNWIHEVIEAPLPEKIYLPFGTETSVSAETGATILYAVDIPEAMKNMVFTLSGTEGSAILSVFNSAYSLPVTLGCMEYTSRGEAKCAYTLTGPGSYTVSVYAETALNDMRLSMIGEAISVTENTRFDHVQLTPGQEIPLYFTLDESVENLDLTVIANDGAASMLLYNLTSGWYCLDSSFGDEKSCTLEHAEPGDYVAVLTGYTFVSDLSVSITYKTPSPILPPAVCEHRVIQQLGKYFVATIDITNVSDQPLTDWTISWSYSMPTNIKLIQNAFLSGTSPYTASATSPRQALAPGRKQTVYLIVKSPQKTAENPQVTGNYCF